MPSLLSDRATALFRTYGLPIALGILVALVSSGDPAFLKPANLLNMLGQWAPAGIMAVGMTYVIIARGFDLSIASGFSVCAIAAAAVGSVGYPPLVAYACGAGVGLVIGLSNGLLACGAGINPFIATVGTGFVLLGVAFLSTPDTYILVQDSAFTALGSGSWLGVPFKGMALVAFLLVGGFVLARTTYGRQIYAIGSNPEASRLTGLRVGLLGASTYVLSGLCMGVSGVLAASQLGSAQARMEPTIVFDVIAIVVVGGTSLAGGYGAIWRTAVGLAIIATVSNGFTLLGLNPFYQGIVKGGVIIVALAFDGWARHLSNTRRLHAADSRPAATASAPVA